MKLKNSKKLKEKPELHQKPEDFHPWNQDISLLIQKG